MATSAQVSPLSLVEAKMNCIKLLGQSLMARDLDRQVRWVRPRCFNTEYWKVISVSIDRIIELMQPPNEPREALGHDWAGFENSFGLHVPKVYKQFLSTHGTGSINNFFWVFNPFSHNKFLNSDAIQAAIDAYEVLHVDFPQYNPRNKGTFIPWAGTDNGDSIVWLVDDGDPDLWRVALQHDTEEVTQLTTSEFLLALLEKKLPSSILPSQFLEAEKQFIPQ